MRACATRHVTCHVLCVVRAQFASSCAVSPLAVSNKSAAGSSSGGAAMHEVAVQGTFQEAVVQHLSAPQGPYRVPLLYIKVIVCLCVAAASACMSSSSFILAVTDVQAIAPKAKKKKS